MDTCPVCGEELYEGEDEQIVTEYQGQTLRFCSREHREEFEEEPGEYAQ